MSNPQPIDRISVRCRPPGLPVMHQTWHKLLFLHWPVPPEMVRRLVPPGVEIDLWDEMAWLSVTPLTISGIRPTMFPPLPILSNSHELNVRTYVHYDGVPGIWFFSLDASNSLAVRGARLAFALPYFDATIKMGAAGDRIEFQSTRTNSTGADFAANWRLGPRRADAEVGTLDFFLVERYCLYTYSNHHIFRARIHHRPWPLREAEVQIMHSSVVASDGLYEPQTEPLVHAQAESLHVQVWRPERVG